jgi:hypothetical protein
VVDGYNSDSLCFDWLKAYQGGWQFGEQGVLYALAKRLSLTGECVEIGAGDGESLPLTIDPFYRDGHRCVLFEADRQSRKKLEAKYPAAAVYGEYNNASQSSVPFDPAVCVIDIDGHDYDATLILLDWCTPSILMVEHFDLASQVGLFSGLIPDALCGERLANGFVLQQSVVELGKLATERDYTLVGITRVNSIFVHNRHLENAKG